jgi:anti-sigma B factor antagonist
MQIVESESAGVVIVEPHGPMDSTTAKPFGDRVVELIRSGSHHLLIDLQHVLYISSAGFRSLLIARKLIDEFDGKLVLCGMSAEIRRLFEMGHFMNMFIVCATRDEGIGKAQ